MNIFNIFRKPKIVSGVLPDIRPPEEKQKDFLTEEILVTTTPLNWITWEEWKDKPENIRMLNDIEVNSQNNVGSCFPGDTPVLTQDFTYKPIRDIHINELIFTHKGELQPVIKTFKRQWQGTMKEIKLWGDFRPIVATREHPIFAIKRPSKWFNKKYLDGQPEFYPIIDLEKGDWVAMPVNDIVKDTTIYNFEKDPDFLWVLGLYLAEGSLDNKQLRGKRICFSLNINEFSFYEKIKTTMSKYGASVTYSFKPKNHGLKVNITGLGWVDIFKELGGEYSHKKQLNKRLMFLPPELQMNIVKGFIDGDGWKNKNRTSVVSTSFNLILQIRTILLRNKIYGSIYPKIQKDRKNAWQLEYSNTARYSFIKDNWCFVQIKSIKDIKSYAGGNVYNLEVQGDNSYLVNGVAVHNCASQAGSLALAINNYIEDGRFIKFSAKPIYARRRNKPSPGMYMDDLAQICKEYGTVPEKLYPSPNDTDANMSNLDDYLTAYESMAKVLRVQNYFWLYDTKNIDSFAQIVSNNKPVVLTVVFGDGEFGTIAPEVKAVPIKYGHAITILPNAFFTYKGQKAVLIQNSWGANRYYGGRQILTEDWFVKGRVVCGIFFEDLNNLAVFNSDIKKPSYKFTNDLYYGMRNSEVAMLQRCLGYEQDNDGYLFPLYQSPTGYFGGLTLKAVKRFQSKYRIEPVAGYVGPKTRTKLNQLFK